MQEYATSVMAVWQEQPQEMTGDEVCFLRTGHRTQSLGSLNAIILRRFYLLFVCFDRSLCTMFLIPIKYGSDNRINLPLFDSMKDERRLEGVKTSFLQFAILKIDCKMYI